MASEGTRSPDWLGRGIGLAVFAGGIILLVVIFIRTNQLGVAVPAIGAKGELEKWLLRSGVEVAKLFISGMVASWIAGRGAQLYASANRAVSGD